VRDGYVFGVELPAQDPRDCRDGEGRLVPAVAVATPAAPGRTGLYEFRLCLLPAVQREDGTWVQLPAVQGRLLPEALMQRRLMFAELRRAAIAQLHSFQRGLHLGFANSPAHVQEVFRRLNSDGDDQISAAEIVGAQVVLGDGSVRLFGEGGLLTEFDLPGIMQLGAGGEQLDAMRLSSDFQVFYEVDPY
jgi:hypothetical protein